MFKIKYLPTGHSFILPEKVAKDLKERFPNDYQILEKNGRKFKDKLPSNKNIDNGTILSKIIEKE